MMSDGKQEKMVNEPTLATVTLPDTNNAYDNSQDKEGSSSFSAYSGVTICSPKRRKLDEEGFVLPSTPDIPVTSVHYPRQDIGREVDPKLGSCVEIPETGSVSQLSDPPQGSDQYNVQERFCGQRSRTDVDYGQGDGQMRNSTKEPYYQERPQESHHFSADVDSNDSTNRKSAGQFSWTPGSDMGSHHPPVDSIKQTMMWLLMKDLEQQTKSLYQNWAQRFSDSERFEEFCNIHIDKLLEEAKSVEENLKQQKEELKNRLQVISKALQSD